MTRQNAGCVPTKEREEDRIPIWDTIARAVTDPLRSARVLHIGCAHGGLLRHLYDCYHIREGYGYDISLDSIETAEQERKNRPLHYAVSQSIPQGWEAFDLAFSYEVLYLQHDLVAHAQTIRESLRPGGSYYAVMEAHQENPLAELSHAALSRGREMPPIYSLDDVAAACESAGFEVAARQLDVGFVSHSTHTFPSYFQAIEHYSRHKMLFRLHCPVEHDQKQEFLKK